MYRPIQEVDEEEERTELKKYNKHVLIGNWDAERGLDLDRQRIFAQKTVKHTTSVGKCRTLFKNFEELVELEEPNKFVPMNSNVQLRPHNLNLCAEKDEIYWNRAALSISCSGTEYLYHQAIGDYCDIMLSRSTKICARNTFRIVGIDGEVVPKGEFLRYEVPFRFQTISSEGDEPTFLYSCHYSHDSFHVVAPTTDATINGRRCLPVGLVKQSQLGFGIDKNVAKACTHWTAVHIDAKQRFYTQGDPVPTFSSVIIKHCITKRNLAIEKTVVQTLFGKEYLTSLEDHKNIYGVETWQNLWEICIQPKRVILFGDKAYS